MKTNILEIIKVQAANDKRRLAPRNKSKETYAEQLMRLFDNGNVSAAGISFGEFIEFLAKETRNEGMIHMAYIFDDNSIIYYHDHSDDYRLEQLYPCDQCHKIDCYCEQY